MSTKFTERAYDYFLGQGYPAHAAAALAGQAQVESGGDTRAVHDKGTGLGLFGWRDPDGKMGRRAALKQFAADRGLDVSDEVTQLQFAQHELTGSEKRWGEALKNAPDYKTATNAVLGYLRPQDYTEANPERSLHYAQRWNAGAPLIGADDVPVHIAGPGPGANPTMAVGPPPSPPSVPPGLLQSDPSTLAAAAATVAAEKQAREQEEAYAGLTKTGMGLLGQAETQAPQLRMSPPPLVRPQVEPPGNPDFVKMLAQQRLARRA